VAGTNANGRSGGTGIPRSTYNQRSLTAQVSFYNNTLCFTNQTFPYETFHGMILGDQDSSSDGSSERSKSSTLVLVAPRIFLGSMIHSVMFSAGRFMR